MTTVTHSPELPKLGPGDAWIEVAAMAQLVGVSTETLRKRTHDGIIPVIDVGKASFAHFKYQLSRADEIREALEHHRAHAIRSGGRRNRLAPRVAKLEAFLAHHFNGEWIEFQVPTTNNSEETNE